MTAQIDACEPVKGTEQQIVKLADRHQVRRPRDDDARVTAKREAQEVSELTICGDEHRAHCLGTGENLGIFRAGESEIPDVGSLVSSLAQHPRC